jgi:NDP-mannose synthase
MVCRHDVDDVRVVILAGGKGTRLLPYTTVFPKPLMPIGEMPILEVVLRQLKNQGFRKITLAVNHLADLIQAFFGDGASLDLEITYCIEEEPLGTAGSISLVQDLGETFLVMNGDLLTTIDFGALAAAHVASGAIATIGAFPRTVKIDFGVLEVGKDGELAEYTEKPVLDYLVSMGVNAFSKSVIPFIPRNEYLDVPTLMMNLKRTGERVNTYLSDCEWLDIGRPEDYENAIADFERDKGRYLGESS